MTPTTESKRPLVVVGYDGSASSRAAVEVAARRAGATGRLVVVHAYQVPADYVGAPYYQDMLDTKLDQASKVIDQLRAEVPALQSVDWEPDVATGSPGPAICRVAKLRRADEIVVGTRGQGRLRAVLGSVSLDVLHEAECPVLVIPDRMVAAAGAAAA